MTKARDLATAASAFDVVTPTEIEYLDGVTSAIQTQIDSKQNSSTAVTLTGTETLSNKTLVSPSVTGALVATGAVIGSAAGSGVGLKSEAAGGSEGGQLNLSPAPTGGAGSDAIIDVNGSALRITPNNFGVQVRLGTDYATAGNPNIRNIYMSTSAPSGGNDGDVWIQYA